MWYLGWAVPYLLEALAAYALSLAPLGECDPLLLGCLRRQIAFQLTRRLRCAYATQPGPGMLSNGQADSASVPTSGASVTLLQVGCPQCKIKCG